MTEGIKYHSIPLPDQLPEREREDAMGAYLTMFAAVAVALPLPIINLIAAIVYYYTNKNKSPFIHFHSLQSLLAQIPTTLMNWGVLYWGLKIWLFKELALDQDFWIYLGIVVLFNISYFTFSIVAAMKARKGKMYYFLGLGIYCRDVVFASDNTTNYNRGY